MGESPAETIRLGTYYTRFVLFRRPQLVALPQPGCVPSKALVLLAVHPSVGLWVFGRGVRGTARA